VTSTFQFPRQGTRFLLYAKPRIVAGFDRPRLIRLSRPTPPRSAAGSGKG